MAILLMVVMIFGMTAAWYSNVIQMNNITVQTEQWGFAGEITVAEAPITAVPGDSGVIDVTIQNDGQEPVDIRVDALKDQMTEDMRKRIYCYVEDSQGTRTYLNSRNGYIYSSVAVGEPLELSQNPEVDGKPLIHWQWVYDVLGYYFLGTVTEQGTVQITEYLMPVEYDLNTAVFDASGKLYSVEKTTEEGTQTQRVDAFLTELFQAYRADLEYIATGDNATIHYGNYYLLDVDAQGNGVFLYLCDKNDIIAETEKDTALLQQADEQETPAAERQWKLTLVFTGQNTADRSTAQAGS